MKKYLEKIRGVNKKLLELELVVSFQDILCTEEIAKVLNTSDLDTNLKKLNENLLIKRIRENGCYTIRNNSQELVGCIFMHKHIMGRIIVYERVTLWVARKYRGNGFGFLLMAKISAHYSNELIISISSEKKVFENNELLGMKHINLGVIPGLVLRSLQALGKIKNTDYRYYVNTSLFKWFKKMKELET
jgi:hypothetical protein